MPRKRKPDPAGKNGHLPDRRPPLSRPEPPQSQVPTESPPPLVHAPATQASSALARLVFAADGRYSVNAHSCGTHYHKWRWSLGKFAGRYVMYVANKWQGVDEGFFGLLEKIDAAHEGRLIPTLDRYH